MKLLDGIIDIITKDLLVTRSTKLWFLAALAVTAEKLWSFAPKPKLSV